MEYVILGLLMLQSMTLYTLNKAFEQGISMFYSPSLGSIQSASKRLLEKGWISSKDDTEGGRMKKILTITDSGRAAFAMWMAEPIDASQLEVSFLSKLYFMGLIEPKAHREALLTGMKISVAQSRDTLKEKQQELQAIKIPAAYSQIFTYQLKVLQYGLDTHTFAMSWIDDLLKDMV